MPEGFVAYGESWRAYHPGWEMRLWTDESLPDLGESRPAFDRGRNQSERSNVLRYELLRSQGGVYIDTDMECLRSIEPLIDGVSVLASHQREGRLGSAIIGAEPHHPAFEEAVRQVRDRTGSGLQVHENGPGFLAEMLAGHSDVTYFDHGLFYPYPFNELWRAGEEFPDAYGVHHWSKTWESREELRAKVEVLQKRVQRFKRRSEKAEREAEALRARVEAIERTWWRRLAHRAAAAVPESVRRRRRRALAPRV